MDKFLAIDAKTGKQEALKIDNMRKGSLCLRMINLSAPETLYAQLPKCIVTKICTIIDGAITLADATLTITNIAAAMGTIVVAFTGSAAGIMDTLEPTANADFDGVTNYLKIAGDGGSTDVCVVRITVEYLYKD